MSLIKLEPTIFPPANFVAVDDAKILRTAMKGTGTNKGAIIDILTRRSQAQRQQIANAFAHEFSRDLAKDLKSEMSGKLEDLMLALLDNHPLYLAKALYKAMAGIGTNEQLLSSILCVQSNASLENIKTEYLQKYGKSLESAVESEVSGDYKKFFILLLAKSRDEKTVDPVRSKDFAERLYEAGEKKLGTDEKSFVHVFSRLSFDQLKLVKEEYYRVYGHTLENVVKKEFSGDLQFALLTTLKYADSRLRYYAEQLESALSGVGIKDEDLLVRIIVSRSEIDLEGIKREYEFLYKKRLYDAVAAETKDDYKTALLNLIGNF